MPPVASWLPVVLILQLLLLAACAWIAVRQVVRPFSQFTRAVDSLDPAASTPMTEKGRLRCSGQRMPSTPCRRAFSLISGSARRSWPRFLTISRRHYPHEAARRNGGEPELRDKLLNDLDNMSRLVREGIAYARSSESLEETSLKLELNAWINSIACDYQDIGKNVHFQASETRLPIVTRPQALRRVMTNLLDNALKFGERAALPLMIRPPARW
jgi:signal transduction histidine kinase